MGRALLARNGLAGHQFQHGAIQEAPQFLPTMERCNARTMEIYRRMGLAEKIRAAGLPRDCPMDVFIVLSLALSVMGQAGPGSVVGGLDAPPPASAPVTPEAPAAQPPADAPAAQPAQPATTPPQ